MKRSGDSGHPCFTPELIEMNCVVSNGGAKKVFWFAKSDLIVVMYHVGKLSFFSVSTRKVWDIESKAFWKSRRRKNFWILDLRAEA